MEGEAFFCSERAFASALTINALAPSVVIVGRFDDRWIAQRR
jgi:hypothetical protein